MKVLYPPIKPYAQDFLKVSEPHVIFFEECGEQTGLPILFVHGGPGAGCSQDDRRFFDPMIYRIVLFDQRGCGRSTPYVNLENNSTKDLIADMEALREHLGIEKWILFGGSWGSTLSLLYAQKHPERVLGLILRGIFLGRDKDLQWLYQDGASRIFPDYWKEFIQHIPEEEQSDLVSAYYNRLTGEDELARMSAAKIWSQWEGQCATLNPCKRVLARFTEPHTALSLACIETHFFKNHCFIKPDQILRDAYKLENIPGIIVHGRYDMLCTLDNATVLHHAWPFSELYIIREAGHASTEPGTVDALVNAQERMAKLFL